MKQLPLLIIVFLFGCQKYDSEILYTQEQLDIINEQTEGVVVYFFNNKVYKMNDLGQNKSIVPNTEGANGVLSLNYTKDKIAYFNSNDQIEIINIDGSNKEVLLQYNARHFEWSKKEDVLFILESGANTLSTYGTSTNFDSPQFAVNVSVRQFCVSKDYLVAYTGNVVNPPYSDFLYVKEGDNTVYLEVFNGEQVSFNTLEFSADNYLSGSYNTDYYYLFTFYFDPNTEFLSQESEYIGFDEVPNLDIFKSKNSYMKNVEDFDENIQGYNIYRFREDGTRKRLTLINNNNSPLIFDWKE